MLSRVWEAWIAAVLVRNTNDAGVAELADARDLKSRGPKGRPGSIPGPGLRKFASVSVAGCRADRNAQLIPF